MSALQFVLDHGVELAITIGVSVVIVKMAWDFVS